jgi:hypothetical protein
MESTFPLRPFEATGRISIVSADPTTLSFAGISCPHPDRLIT